MNWTEPRKSQKFSEQNFSASKKIQTTCLNTPLFDKEYKSGKYEQPSVSVPQIKQKNCPYHFNTQDHVCLTCRKSICVRCAITYCQNHTIKQEKQIIPTLIQDLQKIYIKENIEEIETKLGQSLQRQDYFENKILKLMEKIQQNFTTLISTLNQKKLQIISYFDQEFQKYLNEYRQYDEILKKKLIWLNSVQKQWSISKFESIFQQQKFTIQKIDEVTAEIKDNKNIAKAEKRLNSIMLAKNKLSIDKLWSEEHLQKVLYEIENIPFRMGKDMMIPQLKMMEKKKRIITESSQHQNKPNLSSHKSPMPRSIKGSGRIIYNKFNSGRKNKEQRLQKSQLL